MEAKLILNEKEWQQIMNLFDYWADITQEMPETDENLPTKELCELVIKQLGWQVSIPEDNCDGGCCCIKGGPCT